VGSAHRCAIGGTGRKMVRPEDAANPHGTARLGGLDQALALRTVMTLATPTALWPMTGVASVTSPFPQPPTSAPASRTHHRQPNRLCQSVVDAVHTREWTGAGCGIGHLPGALFLNMAGSDSPLPGDWVRSAPTRQVWEERPIMVVVRRGPHLSTQRGRTPIGAQFRPYLTMVALLVAAAKGSRVELSDDARCRGQKHAGTGK